MVQGDVTNLPALNVRNPEWHFAADMDHATAVATRRKMYDQLVADRMIVQGYHYTFPAAAYIEKDGTGYRPNPVVLAAGAVTRHRLGMLAKAAVGRPLLFPTDRPAELGLTACRERLYAAPHDEPVRPRKPYPPPHHRGMGVRSRVN